MDASQNTDFGSSTDSGMTGDALPIASNHSEGDIVLTEKYSGKKNGKKKLALALGMIGVAAVLLAVLLIMVFNSSDSVEKKYNRYMNYLVYQNDSANKVESIDEINLEDYALRQNITNYDAEKTPAYIKELSRLWNDLFSVLKTGDEITYATDISDGINFLNTFSVNYVVEENQNKSFDEEGDIQEIVTNYYNLIAQYNMTDSSFAGVYAGLLNIYVRELAKTSNARDDYSNKVYRSKMLKNMDSFVLSVVEKTIKRSIEFDWEIVNE